MSRRGHHRGELVPKRGVVVWAGAEKGAPASSRAEARFELLNQGEEPVRIVGTESGCGCATPTLDRDLVMPGAAAVVSLGGASGSEAGILVRTKEPTDDLQVTLGGTPDLSLSVDRNPVGASRRLHRVGLAVERAVPPGRVGEIRLRITASFCATALIVPVRFAPDASDDKAGGP